MFFLFQNTIRVPYFVRFHVYARKHPISAVFAAEASKPPAPAPTSKTILPLGTGGKNPAVSGKSKTAESAIKGAAHVRILCLTEPGRAIHPLELQEDFTELVSSDYVEIRDRSEIEVSFGGNLYKFVKKSSDGGSGHGGNIIEDVCDEFEYDSAGRKLIFHPFADNRQGFTVKRRNEKNPYGKGSISFSTAGSDNVLFDAKIDLSKFM